MGLAETAAVGQALRCMEIWGGNQAIERSMTTPGLEGWLYSRPHGGATHGGDVHYVSLCGGGEITRLIVADVSGHGPAVAEVSGSLRSLMRRFINSYSQTRLVRLLNEQFTAEARMQRFATAVVTTYLASRRQLSVCNAGHPRPLWYAAERAAWDLLTATTASTSITNLPLGLDDETAYEQFEVSLGGGDLIVFHTDALTEAQDASGQMLGEQGLLRLARALEPADPATVGRALLAAVARHRAGQPPDDDLTLLVLRHTGSGRRRRSLGELLDVYAKVFGLRTV